MIYSLYLAIGVGAALAGACAAFIGKHRCRETGLLRIRETGMTAVLGLMLMALGFAFPVLKMMEPTLSGTDSRSYWMVALYSLGCHLLGNFALLFTLVKCTVLYDDRVLALSSFGQSTTLYWKDIVKVEKPTTKSYYLLTDRNGNAIRVGGDGKNVKKFLDFAKSKVKNASGADLLHQVEHRLSGKHL